MLDKYSYLIVGLENMILNTHVCMRFKLYGWIFSENECLDWNQCIRDYIELIATYTFVDLARKWQSGAWVLIRINLWSYFFNCVSFCCTKLAPGCCSQPFSTSVLKNLILNFATLSGYVRILATCTGTATWQKSMAVSRKKIQC
jgi:hypothetical protein